MSQATIVNYMEEIISEVYNRLGDKLDVCKCDRCQRDVLAIALNSLPTKYVVTRKGEIYAKLNVLQQQFDVDVVMKLTEAAKIVKKNPRHE